MDVLGMEELEELLKKIRVRVLNANREGALPQFLTSIGMRDLMESHSPFGNRSGKIVVIGASAVDEQHLLMTAGKLGVDKSRFEFCLDYDAIQKYNFQKLQYSEKYRLILVGPMPHSSKGKSESGSAIAELEKHSEMYPRVIRMETVGVALKITQSGFKETLKSMLRENYI